MKHAPKREIKHGNAYPFDAPDAFWNDDGSKPPPPKDWAHSAARGIISALQDRRGIKHELDEHNIDEETRVEIVSEIASIIRASAPKK